MSGRPQLRALRQEDGTVLLTQLHWCASHWCKFKGLMLRKQISPDEGLLFVYDKESTIETSIHMLFMRFALVSFMKIMHACVGGQLWKMDSCMLV